MKESKGFAVVEAVVVIVVIGAIAAAGLYVAGKQKSDKGQASGSEQNKSAQQQFNWSTSPSGPYHDKVSYATSTDLVNWTDSGVILAEHASVPDVINKDGKLFMYMVDVSTDGKAEQIGLKTSEDNGASWSATTITSFKGIGDKIPVDPAPYLMPDGKIRMYYYDISTSRNPDYSGDNYIYSAISDDGVSFTQEDGVRFKLPGILDPDVIKVGDTWRMYLGGKANKVTTATSEDGLTFTYEGVALEGSAVPNVVHDGSRFVLFTAGIGIAFSDDGKTFTDAKKRFEGKNGMTADPGVAKLDNGSYLMVYKTSDVQPGGGDQPKP